jgi:hypothetical protein
MRSQLRPVNPVCDIGKRNPGGNATSRLSFASLQRVRGGTLFYGEAEGAAVGMGDAEITGITGGGGWFRQYRSLRKKRETLTKINEAGT